MLKKCRHCQQSFDDAAAGSTQCPHCHRTFAEGAGVTVSLPATNPDATRTWANQSATSAALSAVGEFQMPGYEILGVLGRGGMGVVYKARQLSLNRIVALKMIRHLPGRDDSERTRFRREAELLAHVRHPHFVQIFDFGMIDGQPFIAMEYLEGGPLEVRREPWDAAKAARLIATLARAMQVAHTLGIVHLDLKPSNVLMTLEGAPKISDFGLAQRLEALGADEGIVGTPRYMAPEQAAPRPDEIGPATDVYALGGMLYEMLTARSPREGTWPLGRMLELIDGPETVPALRSWRPELPRDLDAIGMKCLAKRPADRYASAAALADDLERFLQGLPVAARPISRIERLSKWIRRAPALAGLTAMVLAVVGVAALLGPAFALQQRQRAEIEQRLRQESQRSYADALAALRTLVDVAMTLDDEPGMRVARYRMLQTALEKYDSLLERHGEDPDILEELGRTYLAWGDVAREQGQYPKSLEAFERALSIWTNLHEREPERILVRAGLIRTYDRLGRIHFLLRDVSKAEAAFHQALDKSRELLRDSKEQGALHAQVANNFSEFHRQQKQPNEVLPLLLEAHKALEEVPAPAAGALETLASFAQVENNIGAYHHARKQPDAAASWFEKALKNRERLVEKQPDNVRYRTQLADSYANLGILERQRGNLRAGRRYHESADAVLERLTAAYPQEIPFFERLTKNQGSLGIVCYDLKDFDEAGRWAVKVVEVRRNLIRAHPGHKAFQYDLAFSLKNLGSYYINRERPKEARTALEEARTVLTPLIKAEPTNSAYQKKLQEVEDLLKKAGA